MGGFRPKTGGWVKDSIVTGKKDFFIMNPEQLKQLAKLDDETGKIAKKRLKRIRKHESVDSREIEMQELDAELAAMSEEEKQENLEAFAKFSGGYGTLFSGRKKVNIDEKQDKKKKKTAN
ncbi:MAG: hypothetical protein GF364_13530 [Candidatus Lokiarchaeota archaeon]|nr:hypothetical protein [Candidatus Lokiarchaeota archaeon]